MKLLMISGDRSVAAGKPCAFTETLRELHRSFERIDILCPRVKNPHPVREIYGNVFLHPASGSLLAQPMYIFRRGKELVAEHHHDVMTVHEYPPFYNGLGAQWLKKSIGIPAVLEVHHIVGWPRAASFSESVGFAMSRALLPRHIASFDAVRVVNRVVKSQLIAWGVPAATIHIVPSLYLDQALIASCKHQTKTFDLVACSRLVDNKGLIPLIDALALMPDATLLVIGDGPLRKTLEARARRYGSRVCFTGWLPSQGDVLRAMASGKIFVMNSLSEGGPRAALEAMALGLPILATPVGIMPDVIDDGVNGLLTTGTAQDVAAKAMSLLSDPQRMASIGSAAASITEQFEKKTAVKAYADFLISFA